MIFKYAEYRKFLVHMKNHGEILPLGEYASSNAIILRHDVDFDIEAAYRLALIEAEYGIRSTFFILTTCRTYNPFSVSNRTKLEEMVKLGFEIGLHFDPTIYNTSNIDRLTDFVNKEAEMLSCVSGRSVCSISLHNPSIHGQYPLFKGYRNAYDSLFFSDEFYFSDSRMEFRGKNPYEFVERVKKHTIQVLLHPLHFTEDGIEYPDIFCKYLKDHVDAIDDVFKVNSTYTRLMKKKDLFSYFINKWREK